MLGVLSSPWKRYVTQILQKYLGKYIQGIELDGEAGARGLGKLGTCVWVGVCGVWLVWGKPAVLAKPASLVTLGRHRSPPGATGWFG